MKNELSKTEQPCPIHSVGRSFSSGQKIKVELEDGTVWNAEVSEENTVIVDCTPEYMSYYEWNYGGGNEFSTPIDNEYQFEDVKVLGVIHNWIQNLVIGGKIDTIVYCFV